MLFCLLFLCFSRKHRTRERTAVNDMFGDGLFEDSRDDPERKKAEWREIVERIDPTEKGETDIDHYDMEKELYKRKRERPKVSQEDELARIVRRMKSKQKLAAKMKRYFVKHIREDLKSLSEKVSAKVRINRVQKLSGALK